MSDRQLPIRDYRYERRLMRRPRRVRLLNIVLIILGVLVALAWVGAFLVLATPEHAPVLTGVERERVKQEVEVVQAELERIKADARRGVSRPFHLVVTDEQLNVLLAEDEGVRETLAERGVQDAWVRIADGTVVATAVRELGGVTVQIQASLVPELAGDRQVHVRVESIRVGRLYAPQAAVQRLAEEVGRVLSRQVNDERVQLDRIEVRGNSVHLIGKTGGEA